MQGVGKTRSKKDKVESTNTMHLIHKKDIPQNNKVTYAPILLKHTKRDKLPEEIDSMIMKAKQALTQQG